MPPALIITAELDPLVDSAKHRTMYPEIQAGELQKRSLTAGDIASIPLQSLFSTFSGTISRAGDDDG